MKKFAALAACSLSLGVLGLAASAAPAAQKTAKATAKKPASVTCNFCKKIGISMPMTATKTKLNTRAVKVNGKSMYCCPQCTMKTQSTKKAVAKK